MASERHGNYLTFIHYTQLINYQHLIKMLQKAPKINYKKCTTYQKKALPLHRFNKQMIVLQI